MAFQFTDENADEVIASGKPVMIDCWATWCGPCMSMAPMIDDLAKEYDGRVVIGKYNVEEESELSGKYRIMALPTFLFFKDGEIVNLRLTGSQSREIIEAKLKELLG